MDTLRLMKCLAGGSLVVITFSAFATIHLLQEINQFYYESMSELADFKDMANEVWNGMMTYRSVHAFESIFRQKREYNNEANLREGLLGYVPSSLKRVNGYQTAKLQAPKAYSIPKNSCGNCAQRSKSCPKGPPDKFLEFDLFKHRYFNVHLDGENGEDGLPGPDGQSAESMPNESVYSKCIQCPAGPQGDPISPDGEVGTTFVLRNPGLPGPIGDSGLVGEHGIEGPPGLPGKNFERQISLPGPKGELGEIGPPGEKGPDGNPAPPASPGPVGASGSVGLKGNDGSPGKDGLSGSIGVPGIDGEYCPCPKRTTNLYANESSPPKQEY